MIDSKTIGIDTLVEKCINQSVSDENNRMKKKVSQEYHCIEDFIEKSKFKGDNHKEYNIKLDAIRNIVFQRLQEVLAH